MNILKKFSLMSEPRKTIIHFEGGQHLEIIIQPRLYAGELVDIVCSHLNLKTSKEFFGICFYQEDDPYKCHWLQMDKYVLEHDFLVQYLSNSYGNNDTNHRKCHIEEFLNVSNIKGETADKLNFNKSFTFSSPRLSRGKSFLNTIKSKTYNFHVIIDLHFRIKFYPLVSNTITNPRLIELLFFQCKSSFLKGEYVFENRAIVNELYALLLQSIKPFQSPEKSAQLIENLIYLRYDNQKFDKNEIIINHETMAHFTRGMTILTFLEKVYSSLTYGVQFYKVKDKNNVLYWLGVSNQGIIQCHISDKSNLIAEFQWPCIENIYYRDKKFSIETMREKTYKKTPIPYPNTLTNNVSYNNDNCHVNYNVTPSSILIYNWYTENASLARNLWHLAVLQHHFYQDQLGKHVIDSEKRSQLIRKINDRPLFIPAAINEKDELCLNQNSKYIVTNVLPSLQPGSKSSLNLVQEEKLKLENEEIKHVIQDNNNNDIRDKLLNKRGLLLSLLERKKALLCKLYDEETEILRDMSPSIELLENRVKHFESLETKNHELSNAIITRSKSTSNQIGNTLRRKLHFNLPSRLNENISQRASLFFGNLNLQDSFSTESTNNQLPSRYNRKCHSWILKPSKSTLNLGNISSLLNNSPTKIVDTAFKLSSNFVPKSPVGLDVSTGDDDCVEKLKKRLKDFNCQREIQENICFAALTLFKEQSINRNIKKARKISYGKALIKLKAIEEKIEKLCSVLDLHDTLCGVYMTSSNSIIPTIKSSNKLNHELINNTNLMSSNLLTVARNYSSNFISTLKRAGSKKLYDTDNLNITQNKDSCIRKPISEFIVDDINLNNTFTDCELRQKSERSFKFIQYNDNYRKSFSGNFEQHNYASKSANSERVSFQKEHLVKSLSDLNYFSNKYIAPYFDYNETYEVSRRQKPLNLNRFSTQFLTPKTPISAVSKSRNNDMFNFSNVSSYLSLINNNNILPLNTLSTTRANTVCEPLVTNVPDSSNSNPNCKHLQNSKNFIQTLPAFIESDHLSNFIDYEKPLPYEHIYGSKVNCRKGYLNQLQITANNTCNLNNDIDDESCFFDSCLTLDDASRKDEIRMSDIDNAESEALYINSFSTTISSQSYSPISSSILAAPSSQRQSKFINELNDDFKKLPYKHIKQPNETSSMFQFDVSYADKLSRNNMRYASNETINSTPIIPNTAFEQGYRPNCGSNNYRIKYYPTLVNVSKRSIPIDDYPLKSNSMSSKTSTSIFRNCDDKTKDVTLESTLIENDQTFVDCNSFKQPNLKNQIELATAQKLTIADVCKFKETVKINKPSDLLNFQSLAFIDNSSLTRKNFLINKTFVEESQVEDLSQQAYNKIKPIYQTIYTAFLKGHSQLSKLNNLDAQKDKNTNKLSTLKQKHNIGILSANASYPIEFKRKLLLNKQSLSKDSGIGGSLGDVPKTE